jgi:hypothetical protein
MLHSIHCSIHCGGRRGRTNGVGEPPMFGLRIFGLLYSATIA